MYQYQTLHAFFSIVYNLEHFGAYYLNTQINYLGFDMSYLNPIIKVKLHSGL